MVSSNKADAAISLAQKVKEFLKERIDLPPSLRPELESQIKRLASNPISASNVRLYDELGTAIWNHSAGLIHEDRKNARLGAVIRVLALLLVETAHRTRKCRDLDQQCRVLKVGIRAAKLCIDVGELDLSLKALEKSSQYIETAESQQLMEAGPPGPDPGEHEAMVRGLSGEYHLLRIAYAWKSNRPDLANHFYEKFELSLSNEDLNVKAADLFYEMARLFFSSVNTEIAMVWIERAFVALGKRDLTTPEAAELFLSIGVTWIEELLKLENDSHRQRAHDIIDQLEQTQELSNRVTVAIARLLVLVKNSPPEPDKITQTLLCVVKTVVLTDRNFDMVMRALHQAAVICPVSALAALKCLISVRLLPELEIYRVGVSHVAAREGQFMLTTSQIWLEKAIVACVLCATSTKDEQTNAFVADVKELLDDIESRGQWRLSVKATHVVQALFWKAGWLEVLRHPILENSGSINKARVNRRIIRDATDRGDFASAREALMQMPSASQNESLTRCAAFKLALQTNDEELATSSLAVVAKNASKDPTPLYACVLEAQKSQMRHIAVAALQATLDTRPLGTHLPSLLRCTGRLLMAELDAREYSDSNAQEVVKVFETAGKVLHDFRKQCNDQWHAEAQWWSKNAYNTAVRLCTEAHPQIIVRLLDACLYFLNLCATDAIAVQQDQLKDRRILCAFLSTTALIVLGRSGDGSQGDKLQCYLYAQQHIQIFKTLQGQTKRKSKEATANAGSNDRTLAMLRFELECILQLRQWDKLGAALQACMDARDIGRWETLADLLILIHEELADSKEKSHRDMIRHLIGAIVNDTWDKEQEITKFTKWLRFTLKICLEEDAGEFALTLLETAAKTAERAAKGKTSGPYPENELQWLATISFNRAVDLLIIGKEGASRWVDSALSVARWSDDNGALHGMLTRQKEELLKRLKSCENTQSSFKNYS